MEGDQKEVEQLSTILSGFLSEKQVEMVAERNSTLAPNEPRPCSMNETNTPSEHQAHPQIEPLLQANVGRIDSNLTKLGNCDEKLISDEQQEQQVEEVLSGKMTNLSMDNQTAALQAAQAPQVYGILESGQTNATAGEARPQRQQQEQPAAGGWMPVEAGWNQETTTTPPSTDLGPNTAEDKQADEIKEKVAIQLKGLSYGIEQKEIEAYFTNYTFNRIDIQLGLNLGFGAVLFKNAETCEQAIMGKQGDKLGDKEVELEPITLQEYNEFRDQQEQFKTIQISYINGRPQQVQQPSRGRGARGRGRGRATPRPRPLHPSQIMQDIFRKMQEEGKPQTALSEFILKQKTQQMPPWVQQHPTPPRTPRNFQDFQPRGRGRQNRRYHSNQQYRNQNQRGDARNTDQNNNENDEWIEVNAPPQGQSLKYKQKQSPHPKFDNNENQKWSKYKNDNERIQHQIDRLKYENQQLNSKLQSLQSQRVHAKYPNEQYQKQPYADHRYPKQRKPPYTPREQMAQEDPSQFNNVHPNQAPSIPPPPPPPLPPQELNCNQNYTHAYLPQATTGDSNLQHSYSSQGRRAAQPLIKGQQYGSSRGAMAPWATITGRNRDQAQWQEVRGDIDGSNRVDSYIQPSEDFSKMPINPTFQELKGGGKPYLRKLRTKGPYDCLNHYLGVNFRLLKEDFCHDLREGIRMYKDPNIKSKRKKLVNIYENAQIAGFFAEREFFGLNLIINLPKEMRNQSWKQQKSLLYGQLVTFSDCDDKFENQIYMGVIRQADRGVMDESMSKSGHIKIGIELINNGDDELRQDVQTIYTSFFGKQIVVIESKAYYEAFYHVMNCLQQTKDLQFEKIIIGVDQSTNDQPEVWKSAHNFKSNLSKFIDDSTLDSSQAESFRYAFQRKVALIQGPPGTGKTFVGAQLVKFILEQQRRPKKGGSNTRGLKAGPILLTCFTNHALDQFIGHVEQVTTNIVRLGGQSNEEFQKYQIQEIIKSKKTQLTKTFYNQGGEIKDYRGGITKLHNQFKQSTNDYVYTSNICIPTFQIIVRNRWNIVDVLGLETYGLIEKFFQQIEGYYKNAFKQQCESIGDPGQIDKFTEFYNQKIENISAPDVFFFMGLLNIEHIYGLYQQDSLSNNQIDTQQESKQKEDGNIAEGEQNVQDKDVPDTLEEIGRYEAYQTKISNFLNECPLISDRELKQIEVLTKHQGQISTYSQLLNANKQIHCAKHEEDSVRIENLKERIKKFGNDLTNLQIEDIWIINHSLSQVINKRSKMSLDSLTGKIKKTFELMTDLQEKQHASILQTADIVAMTTTGAAKYKSMLRKLNTKIMIVEEAAEILEAHITTSISHDAEHLILIGDHKQLKPSVNVFELEAKYNLHISMFERLINNRFPVSSLTTQRRMRPEICNVVRLIYPRLVDHVSVYSHQDVQGMNGSNYLFFTHQFRENSIEHLQSKENPEEAQLVIRFANYLLQQNYKPAQITILALYNGQLLRIKNIILNDEKFGSDHPLSQISVRTLDNYQGEENDVVIVSLVRNNPNNNIGFLKDANRVCVTLSRARQGLYIFGNKNNLKKARFRRKGENNIWVSILQLLQAQNAIVDKLQLQCLCHSNVTEISKAEDFDETPAGGCKEICKMQMDCGHKCGRTCHFFERNQDDPSVHASLNCRKRCPRERKCGHRCQNPCWKCSEGHKNDCMAPDERYFKCGHRVTFRCHETYNKRFKQLQCTFHCVRRLDGCGHLCGRMCKEDCYKIDPEDLEKGYTSPCKSQVGKALPCGHKALVDCGLPIERYFEKNSCQVRCGEILGCGHQCPNNCGQCFGKAFHGDCLEKCERANICGHVCEDKCSDHCPPCKRPCSMRCTHQKCPKTCGEPCKPCNEKCEIKCEHSECSKKCFELCDREPCQHPCPKKLQCGHDCIGFCGETCPSVC